MARRIAVTVLFVIIIQLFSSTFEGSSFNSEIALSAHGQMFTQVEPISEITISINPEEQIIAKGGSAEFSILIENTGETVLNNVSVTDSLSPSCVDEFIPTLTPGAANSYSCLQSGVNDTLSYDVYVTAEDEFGIEVTGTVSAVIQIANPTISINNEPKMQKIVSGETVEFTALLENTGNVELLNIIITHPEEISNCDITIQSLGPGNEYSDKCIKDNVTNGFTDIAIVEAEDNFGNIVTAEDTAEVQVLSPDISISKTAVSETVVQGGTAEFEIAINNVGDVALENIAVTDQETPNCERETGDIPALDPTDDYTYSCNRANITTGFVNEAMVTADDGNGNNVTAKDTATIQVVNPEISISKTAVSETVVQGGTAEFDIKITNLGDVTLENVAVTDQETPNCEREVGDIPALDPTDDYTYSCNRANITKGFVNEAMVTADDGNGNNVTAKDTATIQVVNPGVSISKTAVSEAVVKGGTAEFEITIENLGDVTLENIAVTDLDTPNCKREAGDIPSLDPTEDYSYSCIQENVTDGIENTARVTADYGNGNEVSAEDTAVVKLMDISITKTALIPMIAEGGTAEFKIEVTNTGEVTLKNIDIVDQAAEDCRRTISSLNPAGVSSDDCALSNVDQDLTNKASVTIEDDLGNKLTVDDSASVEIAEPVITINKTTNTPIIAKDGTANFNIQIKNTGNVPLKNIAVEDPNAVNCRKTVGTIPPLGIGEMYQYSCSRGGITQGFTNKATVSAEDNYRNNVTAEATATIKVADISITKQAVSNVIIKGNSAVFNIVIKNTGEVTLNSISVTDQNAVNCTRAAGAVPSLSPGGVHSYSCTQTNVTQDFTNVAKVEGQYAAGKKVSAQDSAAIDVIFPQITITKTTSTPTIAQGGTAVFRIDVKNTGDVPLKTIYVRDGMVPDCNLDSNQSLAPSATISKTCYLQGVESDFWNTATVEAKDNYNHTVNDTASVWIDVQNPDISIFKSPPAQTILKGDPAVFYITIGNPSKVADLTDVKILDQSTPDCSKNFNEILEKEGSFFYSCQKDSVSEPFTNEIQVSGRNVFNNQIVTDTSIAVVEILDMLVTMEIEPAILTTPGEVAYFNVIIENNGSVPFKLQSLNVDPLGSITDPNNSNLANNSCEGTNQLEVTPGEKFNCSFSINSEENPDIYPFTLTVEAREENGKSVTKNVNSSLIVADSTMLSVSLGANPASLPGPETAATIEETIIISNPSQTSTLTLNTLIHSELGNLNNVGNCTLPQTIEPEDSYTCSINIDVAGQIGDIIFHEVSAAGSTEDGQTVGNITQTPIYFFNEENTINWLPVVSRSKEHPEEENDNVCASFSILTNVSYQFTLDDKNDWFKFEVDRSGQGEIIINNLVSNDAQVTLFDKEDCSQVTLADRVAFNGDSEPSKSLGFPAKIGTYFLRVQNNDSRSLNSTYTLFVQTP